MSIDGKKLISPIVYFLGGLFGFIFMAINHISAFMSHEDEFETEAIATGYKFFDLDFSEASSGIEGEFLMVFVVIFLSAVILACIALMGVGAVKFVKELAVDIPGMKVFSIIGKIASLVYLIASGASYTFILIFGLVNINESYGYTFGMLPGVGAYMLIVFAAATFVLTLVMDKICQKEEKDCAVCVCSSCGKICNSGSAFCDACGNAVVKQLRGRVCSVCGAKAGKKDDFCISCGGVVVEQTIDTQAQTPTGV